MATDRGNYYFIAINAFGGGSMMSDRSKSCPKKEWLEGSPFSFFIPSLILFVVVGEVVI